VSNGVGITRDMDIIRDILSGAGYEVECHHSFRTNTTKKFDLGIWLERFNPKHFELCDINILIPNQEWFEPGWMPVLPEFKVILTKTKYADEIFRNLDCSTEYISFTSEDRYLPQITKDDYHWIHVAGKSIQKQTETVITTWVNNPGFPQLTIVQDPKFYKPRPTARNINYMIDRVPDDILKTMQNCNAVHVCPSTTEGFGHYIMEAMSCKCTPLTTNAAPMTELVTEDRGFLVNSVRQEQMRLSLANFITEKDLEKSVIQITITEDAKKREMGEKAREYFLKNDCFFRERLLIAVGNVLE
jgi:hypothetical protein